MSKEDEGASLRETGSRPTGQAPSGLDASRFDPARGEVASLIEELLAVSMREETSPLNRSMMQAAAAHLSRLST